MNFILPPGPRGKWRPTLKIVANPRRAFERWVSQFGDPFLVNALNGPIVVTGRSDLVKQVFGEDPGTFVPFAMETVQPMFGAGSMLLLSGDIHKRERRLIMPMFHGDRMKAYGQAMSQAAERVYANLAQEQSFLTLPRMNEISLQIIARTIFGGNQDQRAAELVNAGRLLVRASRPLLFFSKKMHVSFLGLSPWDRFCAARQKLYRAFDQECDSRLENQHNGDDILSHLMAAKYENGEPITREHVRDELGTFLFAGHETSALAMTWAMYHLHRHPEFLLKLRTELDSIDGQQPAAFAQLAYLKAVVQESLRMHPIVTEVLRLLARPMQLGDYSLPAGMAIAPCTVLAHYNPQVFPEPDQFRPERFLEKSYSPFEYMPFGGGHRRCIGAAFATFEMAIVLGTLLKRFEFELLEPKPVVQRRRNVTLGPSTGVRMRLVRQRSE